MPLETVKLTASFKLNGSIPEGLFSTYREVLDQLLDHACAIEGGRVKAKLLHGTYHEKFKEVVAKAKEAGASTIVMEDLEKIRRKHKKGDRRP